MLSTISEFPPQRPIRLALLGAFALVVLLFAAHERDGDLDEGSFIIYRNWH